VSLEVPLAGGEGTLPRPSRHGIGEVIALQEALPLTLPGLRWEPSAHEARRTVGKGVFTFPLGPVRADVAESVGYQLSVMGDEIVRLDLSHGLKHRAITRLARGRPLPEAAAIVERYTGTSTVAHALAFSLAVEEALGLRLPPEAHARRVLMAELERLHSHLWDLAQLAASTGLPLAQMEYLHLREEILRLGGRLSGHRYLRGRIRPGGDLPLEGLGDQRTRTEVTRLLEAHLGTLRRITDALFATPSFLDRLHGAGRIPAPTVAFVRPVGPVGRASGRSLDARSWRPYAAYGRLAVQAADAKTADAYARFLVRTREAEESIRLVLAVLPESFPPHAAGARRAADAHPSGVQRGIGIVEAPRGLLVYRVAVDTAAATVRHLAVATPSARNWYALPPAVANHNILQDFPIIDASFALSVAGWDG
jgi:formate hydrogenlyase subunit 5